MEYDYLEVLDSDDRRGGEAKLWKGRDSEFMKAGTKYIYWRAPDRIALRAVYNILPGDVDEVVSTIRRDRTQPYEDLVGDLVGAGFGDEGQSIRYVS